ncbi:hypothetical protein NP493_747g01015 [Ridgeia piscesae]|uniref:Uncharacterized protein n=1 Tax=Ridgeia piscesae TaxID=27915 RepID=A0AAD9KR61_RIDPI|nr:hypothetical protein NP493_747g01015 [Ridgeia piscesae]
MSCLFKQLPLCINVLVNVSFCKRQSKVTALWYCFETCGAYVCMPHALYTKVNGTNMYEPQNASIQCRVCLHGCPWSVILVMFFCQLLLKHKINYYFGYIFADTLSNVLKK